MNALDNLSNGTALQAYENGKLGLSFGGAGFLILYYVGVVQVLQQLGIFVPGKQAPPVAGISSGALTAGVVCSGVSAERFHETVHTLMQRCREKGGCAGHMDQTVRDILNHVLPTDAAQRCSGNFFAGVTVLQDNIQHSPLASVVDSWSDRADLISTLAASAYIPIWSGSRLFTRWRGKDTADGSLSIDQPCPPGVEYCVKISSRAPDARRVSVADTVSAIARALAGLPAAAARIVKPSLPERPPKISPWRLAAMRAAGLDIAPGLSVSSSVFDASTWTELGLIPCDPDTCTWLEKLGRLDAMAWAEATGIAQAAARKLRAQRALLAGRAAEGAAGAGGGAAAEAGGRPVPAGRR